MSYMTSIGSPTLSPPIAYASKPIATVSARAFLAELGKDAALHDAELRLPGVGHRDAGDARRRAASSRRVARAPAQRSVRSIEARAAPARPDARGTRRAPSRRPIRAAPGCPSAFSGVSRCAEPSRCDWKRAPSSSIVRRAARLNTW